MENYPYAQELANALTHGTGFAIFSVLSPLLIAITVQTKSTYKITGICFFSFGLLAVYMSSTIFHAIPDKVTKEVLHSFDLLSIYLLISGTYTAFILIYFKDKLGAILLSIIWLTSLLGIILKISIPNASFIYSLMLYLVLGWAGIVLIKPSIGKMPRKILYLIIAGGVTYTAGTYFIYNDSTVKYYHAVWHIFVLGGSLMHWTAVLLAVKSEMKHTLN